MKLYKTQSGPLLQTDSGGTFSFYLFETTDWDVLICRKDLRLFLDEMRKSTGKLHEAEANELIRTRLLAPLGRQEVWAAGVTYYRSRTARMEEAEALGGSGNFYDRVYVAERPELFFKATPHRVSGPGQPVRIRKDSEWDVPEPEFTLFVSPEGTIEAYTIGNDMSSRSIEGQNPLYLPQAKTYDQCAALGPCLYLPEVPLAPETSIRLEIRRDGVLVFSGDATLSQMKRSFEELKGFLIRECSFPDGAFLMTGTCIVPENDFTLHSGDQIDITVPPIGTLSNIVA